MLLHRLLNGSRILLSPAHASNTPVVESVWFSSRSAHDSLFITIGEALSMVDWCSDFRLQRVVWAARFLTFRGEVTKLVWTPNWFTFF